MIIGYSTHAHKFWHIYAVSHFWRNMPTKILERIESKVADQNIKTVLWKQLLSKLSWLLDFSRLLMYHKGRVVRKYKNKKCLQRLQSLSTKDRPRFFDEIGHQSTYAYIKNKHFLIMSSSDLPKLWTTSSKIAKFVLSKSFFSIKNQRNLSDFFFCEEY